MEDDSNIPKSLSDKELLKRILEQGKAKRDLGADLMQQGTWEADVARAGLLAVQYQATGQHPSPMTNLLSQLCTAQEEQLTNLKLWTAGTAVNSTAYVSAVTTDLTLPEPRYYQFTYPEQRQEVMDCFETLIERHGKVEEVLHLMEKVKLGKTEHGQNAIRQFKSAWAEHKKGPSTPTASLIPLREAVDITVDQVFQRRPIHEKGRTPQRERIIKIGQHLAAPQTSPEVFTRLQKKWGDLKDDFSESKDKDIDRQTVHHLMLQGTLFLIEFLSAVDVNKLR